MMDIYGIFYSLSGEGMDYPELMKYARFIKRQLLSVNGVKRVQIAGDREETIDIIVSKEQIARNGMLPTQIMMALQSAGKPANAGGYEAANDKVRLQVDEGIDDVEELRRMVISSANGKTLRLGDVAEIKRTLTEPQRNGFFVDGKPSLAICVAMEKDAIVPDVGKAVDRKMEETMKSLPVGLDTEKIFFQPDKVTESVNSFMINLLESVLIVIVVLIFTMGFRSGMIIGFGLVLTIALSFPILLKCGTTLQRISLGAFIVAMGMLVDNAVVIMDGILVDRKRGLPEEKYLYRIGSHTAMPLLGATIIAAATFMCIYLSPDSVGEYAGDLFLVLCISLLASWVLALVQVPVCARAWLPKKITEKKQNSGVMDSPVHRAIRRTVQYLISHRWTTITLSLVLLALSLFGLTKVKNLFFPDFDYKQFVVECYFPRNIRPMQ